MPFPLQYDWGGGVGAWVYFFTLITCRAYLGYPGPSSSSLPVQAYVSLGSHGEYAQEQLTIYAGGAPTFSEREGGVEAEGLKTGDRGGHRRGKERGVRGG